MRRWLLFLILFTISSLAEARQIQIIHTNDLHSYFTGYYNNQGGYARVKSKIDQIKQEAAAKGIEVLQVDAGDWSEGTSFYLSNNGSDSVKALELFGVEVATIGNHDFQLGGKNLANVINRANVSTQFTVANMQTTPDMGLDNVLTPYVDIEKGGVALRIVGLTTNELFFQYAIAPGKILSPYSIGESQARKGKDAGREVVIALTHIGLTKDKRLARGSRSIDVIIGGHSHSKVTRVINVRNRIGKTVPIVQAWAHGLGVGSLVLDIDESNNVRVVSYKLYDISSSLPSDASMQNLVNEVKSGRNANLDYDANEVIGQSNTPLTGYLKGEPVHRSSCWGYHMATAAKLATNSDVGIHIAAFEGVYKPAGPVTYGDLASNFPHLRKFGDQGWEIATVQLAGWKLKPLMYIISRLRVGVTFSGLGYRYFDKIQDKAIYRVAFPAEVALAIRTTFPKYIKYLDGLKSSGQYYWPVMVDYIRANTPISCQ